MGEGEALALVETIAASMEEGAAALTPAVIRAARKSEAGTAAMQRMEDAIGTIGKALILTDFKLDQAKDLDKLKGFRAQP